MVEAKAGADLTEYDSPEDFQVLVDFFGLELSEEDRRYVWESDTLTIVTGANPLTGERRGRDEEPGYASYMRFEGDEESVEVAVRFTKDCAFTDGPIGLGETGFI